MQRPSRRQVIGPRSDGARRIDRYLREHRTSVPNFCEMHGLDRLRLQRLLGGQVKEPSIALAMALEAATEGYVTIPMFAESTVREDRPEDVRRAAGNSR